jgi:Sulfate permease family
LTSVPAWVRSLRPEPGALRQDVVAGVPGAIASVPDGMASAVLVGVNPLYGLDASMAGPIGGGLAVSINDTVRVLIWLGRLAGVLGWRGRTPPACELVESRLASSQGWR